MQPATITTATEQQTVSVNFGADSGQYRYVTDARAAADSLAWVIEAAKPPLLPESLSSEGAVLGIDIETTSLKPAEGRIRLCQIAAGDRCVVLDCFAFDPWPVLRSATEGIGAAWIAHNAEFEQSWLARHGGFTLGPMFDTRWVFVRERARRSGTFAPAHSNLAVVCEELLGFELSKEQRLSDWTTPELSFAQIEYAALDSLVLTVLREKLERDAIAGGWTAEIAAAVQHSAEEARRFA
jgi:ribonuclease D